MQTDAEPFLQRIRAFPDDDVPRLIFADWLEEQGGRDAARADFIRVQVALAGLSEDDPRRPGLVLVERDLFEEHREQWEAPVRGLATAPQFRRGFVDEVNVTAGQFLRHAEVLFAAGPIRRMQLQDVGEDLAAVMQSPYLGRLRSLTVYAEHAGEPLARLAARCPHLVDLRELHFGRNRLDDDAAEHLAGSPVLAALEVLDLAENDLTETGARLLAASPALAKLRVLELRHNHLGPAGAEAIASSDRLGALERLGLAGNGFGVPRVFSLARITDLLRIPTLDLAGNTIGPAVLKAILTPPAGHAAIRLRDLDLSHNPLAEAGVHALVHAPATAEVRTLRLVGCGITDAAAEVLAAAKQLCELSVLELANNPLSTAGLRAFRYTQSLRGLKRLVVPGLDVMPQMVQALGERFRGGVAAV